MQQLVINLFFLSIVYFFPLLVSSQSYTFDWAQQAVAGPTASDYPEDMALDASGNVYNVGRFFGNADLDPGTGTLSFSGNGFDGYIQKLDANGNLVWAVPLYDGSSSTTSATGIAIDNNGDILVSGYFINTVDFDPGAGTFNLSAPIYQTIGFILKLDPNGNFIWAKALGSKAHHVATGSSNEVYVVGSFQNTVDFDPGVGVSNLTSNGDLDVYALKLDASGNFVWAINYGGSSADEAFDIALTSLNELVICGYFRNTADFDPGTGTYNLTSNGTQDAYILKLNSTGNLVWAKSYGSPGGDYAYGVTADALGNIYATGYYFSTVDFDPGAGVFNLSTNGNVDAYVLKLDPSGNFVWAISQGGSSTDLGESIHVGPNGDLVLLGRFKNTVDFDPGTGIFNLSSAGGYDVFVQRLDPSNGAFIYAGTISGSPHIISRKILSDSMGSLYLLGSFFNNAPVDFNPEPGVFNMISLQNYDGYLVKLNPTVPLPVQLLNFNAQPENNQVKTFWSTTSEINNAQFTVLRSKDGFYFEPIGTIPGAGNSNIVLNYSFYDKQPLSGVSYYQLEQTDFDGSSTRSNIVSVNRDDFLNPYLFPNPTNGKFYIQLISPAEKGMMEIIDALGKTIFSVSINQKNKLEINLSNQPKGIYLVKVTMDNNTSFHKVLLE